jgi:hypothetical protein
MKLDFTNNKKRPKAKKKPDPPHDFSSKKKEKPAPKGNGKSYGGPEAKKVEAKKTEATKKVVSAASEKAGAAAVSKAKEKPAPKAKKKPAPLYVPKLDFSSKKKEKPAPKANEKPAPPHDFSSKRKVAPDSKKKDAPKTGVPVPKRKPENSGPQVKGTQTKKPKKPMEKNSAFEGKAENRGVPAKKKPAAPKKGLSAFEKAFAAARKRGDEVFSYTHKNGPKKGKTEKFHTKRADGK